jgi:uncharacterized short protein YbdD (DUF466 family)
MNLKSQISNLKWLWWWLRQVCGDAAYENYVKTAVHQEAGRAAAGSCGTILSREQFYLDALRRRYTGVSRCC